MLENGLNQGVGLRRIAPHTPLRLMALASHGDKASELPLLWSLCSAWVVMGYPIAVLDVTATESDDNPGLQQMLDGTYWNESADSGTTWSILPAFHGLEQLSQSTGSGRPLLHQLPELFPQYEIVLIYAHTDVIVSLFQDGPVSPLLTLSPEKQALLTAYQSTKQLLLNARLHPTIVSLLDESTPGAQDAISKSLQDCAMNFLGQRITTLTARSNASRKNSTDDMKRLALRLLENSAVLERDLPATLPGDVDIPSRHARKH